MNEGNNSLVALPGVNPNDPDSLSARFRSKRDIFLRAFIERKRAAASLDRPFRILDLGGTNHYWGRVGYDWIENQNLEVFCTNLRPGELGAVESPRIYNVVGDACDMRIHPDNSFDLVHSNSVIEHVGRWTEMVQFAAEVRRLATSYYVQTPYFWCPIDPHFYRVPFYHWMPEPVRLKLHQIIKVGRWPPTEDVDEAMRRVQSNVLLSRGQFKFLFPEAVHQFERLAGIPKSLVAFY